MLMVNEHRRTKRLFRLIWCVIKLWSNYTCLQGTNFIEHEIGIEGNKRLLSSYFFQL